MGVGVLSAAAMAAWRVLWLLSLSLAAAGAASAVTESPDPLLVWGERALCMASHSRLARVQGRTPSRHDYRRPLACPGYNFNVFLVFNVRPCSGALLSGQHVITSAYCTEHADNGTAFMGGNKYQSPADLRKPGVQIALITEFISYEPKGDEHLDHDVIICKLDRKIEETETISYAQLTSLTKWEETSLGIQMGFGETFEGDSAHELRSGKVYLECGQTCAPYVKTARLGDNALCGVNATDLFVMCWGDVGGAVADSSGNLTALISYKQMKKPSFRLCAEPPEYTYFMFLGYYRDWIDSILNPTPIQEEEK